MAPNSVDLVGFMPGVFDSGQHQVILWILLAVVCAFLLLTILIFLCNSCYRHLNTAERNGDNENLMSVPSEKEANSYSVSNFGNEVPANGHTDSLANGDILSDEIPNIQSSENAVLPMVVNQQENSCKSSKCPQSRELPQIPGNDSIPNTESTTVTESETSHGVYEPYEVLKASSLQDIIVEDSLYETVKEPKDESGSVANEIYSQSEDSDIVVQCQNPKLTGATPEYATVSKVKMNQQSTSVEEMVAGEDDPPTLPIKELNENENVDGKGAEISAMYSTVNKPAKTWSQAEAEQEGGYASIDEVTPQRRPSTASHLYASVADYDREPKVAGPNPSVNDAGEESDPGYEPIRAPKEESIDKGIEPNENGSQCNEGEHDYESIRELEQKQKNEQS
ncbi:phosphoprotein associated with glycosphingolipid-enriched microdomains 1 [Stegostoma tigrinum]|uniref:phosphoprotein associated with glycosphingolipid-enriched microdomains 1 n=1 Tax=Stegostoma tigrinum TaxID=3053191 RepID=UPI00202B7C4F|nr:phosphoprotein associated with glycosphingolipid-enriched microdomains 1 [Stegostoma tigrinum]XP_048385684.1 phosphoprotein associated with glycosphingolipid-enriched microdomains 1 [Stegostoma tigrinum]XP_048385685.1 phosphoprotein associated with glycosphingolipid-enriched microdomains 1 [Stegostoma tigrinum]XP_048385687.1 phosphoprotein associated with glycosphingolipid-enriched microdomains 1 [Stegostoma tigrinum]XP_048385688.1 phosphoprotein associated with glycosphingolipid-enriched mi